MATDCIPQVTFQGDGFPKPIVARFDQPDASSDGGLVLVKALDTHLGLTARLAACLDDGRQPGKVLHETIELLAAAHLRGVRRVRRLQRRRPAGPRPDPQTGDWARS